MELDNLPSEPEAEEAVIGACLQGGVQEAVETLGATGEMFHEPTNAVIYETIVQLDARNIVPDGPMLLHHLEAQPSMINGMSMLEVIGGPDVIHEILGRPFSIENATHYATIVWRAHVQRKMIRAGAELARLGYLGGQQDIHSLISKAETTVYNIRSGESRFGAISAEQAATRFWNQIEQQIADPDYHRGWQLGIPNLDAILGHIDPGRLVVMAGRPGFGKTTTSLWVARDMAIRRREPVMVAVYEQDCVEHIRGLVAMETGIDSMRLKHPNTLTPEELELAHQATGVITSSPLYFIELGDPVHITSTAKRISAKAQDDFDKPLAMLVVDYLGLMPPMPNSKATTRDREVGEISRHFKLFSKEMELVTILISQLNREPERRNNHRPMLSDLRESGNIEQDADIVIFTYCALQYMDDNARRRALAEYTGELDGYEPYEHIVAKWRAGRTGTAHNAWQKSTGRIVSMRTRP
jgi:replicative DNA helicase